MTDWSYDWSSAANNCLLEGFDVLCIQKCFSAHLDCVVSGICGMVCKWIFELMLSSYQLETVWLFFSDLWHQQDIFNCITLVYFLFYGPFALLEKFGKIPAEQFVKYPNQPVCHQQLCHVISHLNHLSSIFGCSVWSTCLHVLSCYCVIG